MSFDALAPHYRWMEWLLAGGKLQRCRTAFLAETQPAGSVLLLGEGNGRFLKEFLEVNRQAEILVVDSSRRMLREAQRRTPQHRDAEAAAKITYICTDVLEWAPPHQGFDLLVTNFFLDCFRPDQLEVLIPRLAAAARPDAHWVVADFCLPEQTLARWRAQWILAAMYGFFRLVTRLPARSLTPVDGLLAANGFQLQKRRRSEWGLLHSDLWRKSNSP